MVVPVLRVWMRAEADEWLRRSRANENGSGGVGRMRMAQAESDEWARPGLGQMSLDSAYGGRRMGAVEVEANE